MRNRIISLGPLYEFVHRFKEEDEALDLRSSLSKPYRDRCKEITNCIEESQGFYLWGCYARNGLWKNLYLGKAGRSKKAYLRLRILEELKDERCCFWRVVRTTSDLLRIGPKVHPSRERWFKKIKSEWERSFHKAGTTHIVWAPAPQLSNDDVRRVEADLIEALNPIANLQRPAPPSTVQQEDVAHIFKQFRQSIHSARETRFAADIVND